MPIDETSLNRGSDTPINFCWQSKDLQWQLDLGLEPAGSARLQKVLNSILCQMYLLSKTNSNSWISYSRNHNFYAQRARYLHRGCGRSTVIPAIDLLHAKGLIEHDKATPGRIGLQSRFRATRQLLQRLAVAPTPVPSFDPGPCSIRLKDQSGKLTGYRDTAQTDRMADQLALINAAMESTTISVPELVPIHGTPLARCGTSIINTAAQNYYRVFNRQSFHNGGRLYGPFWQSLPSPLRRQIRMNDEEVVELDYAQLHPKMLYALAGTTLEFDAYTIDEWPRPVVKNAFNVLVNANTQQAAIGAISRNLGGAEAVPKAGRLITAIRKCHKPIAQYFGSGEGLRLQRIDSDMAVRVHLEMLKRGEHVLSIHDSFIARSQYAPDLRNVMHETLEAQLVQLRRS